MPNPQREARIDAIVQTIKDAFFPDAYLDYLAAKIEADATSLDEGRTQAIGRFNHDWLTEVTGKTPDRPVEGKIVRPTFKPIVVETPKAAAKPIARAKGSPAAEPKPEPTGPKPHYFANKTPQQLSNILKARARVARLNKGKPRFMDLIGNSFPETAKNQPLAYVIFGEDPDPDYDIVAQIDPNKPWCYRIKVEDTQDNDHDVEVWEGGFAETEEAAWEALKGLDGYPGTDFVAHADYMTWEEAIETAQRMWEVR